MWVYIHGCGVSELMIKLSPRLLGLGVELLELICHSCVCSVILVYPLVFEFPVLGFFPCDLVLGHLVFVFAVAALLVVVVGFGWSWL